MNIKHQAADAFSGLKTTRIVQMWIGDEISVLCISASIFHENVEADWYWRDYDVINYKEGIVLPAVHAIATSLDTEYDKSLVAAQEFI